jgi:hypothetical protein
MSVAHHETDTDKWGETSNPATETNETNEPSEEEPDQARRDGACGGQPGLPAFC